MITTLTDKPKKHISKLGLEGTRTPRYHPQCRLVQIQGPRRKAEAQTSQPKAGDEIEAGESEPEYPALRKEEEIKQCRYLRPCQHITEGAKLRKYGKKQRSPMT